MKPSNPPIKPDIAIAVLAAGQGSRFGGAKLDAPLEGKAVGQWVTDTVEQAGFHRRMIVTGEAPPRFAKLLTGWEQVINHSAQSGIASSIQAAVNASAGCERLVIVLADMPLVDAHFLRLLAAGSRVTFTQYPSGKCGVPAAFPARAFDQLAQLSGETGAAQLNWGEEIERRSPADTVALQDVDTSAQLSAIARHIAARS